MQAFFGVEKVLELTPQRQNCLELCKSLLAESCRLKRTPATINERLSEIIFKLSLSLLTDRSSSIAARDKLPVFVMVWKTFQATMFDDVARMRTKPRDVF